MTQPHNSLVQSQFGPGAADYITSTVHAHGADLQRIAAIAATHAPVHTLDLGCGGGHVAYAMAPHAEQVTACDLSPDMTTAVAAEAARRGLGNIQTSAAPAAALPFADGAFEMLACRFSAHHWQDVPSGLREARRVLRPGGVAVFADVFAPPLAAADTHLQAVELLRDPSHVRDYGEQCSHRRALPSPLPPRAACACTLPTGPPACAPRPIAPPLSALCRRWPAVRWPAISPSRLMAHSPSTPSCSSQCSR